MFNAMMWGGSLVAHMGPISQHWSNVTSLPLEVALFLPKLALMHLRPLELRLEKRLTVCLKWHWKVDVSM